MSFKYLSTLQITKNSARFTHAPFHFISFYLFVFTFAIKLKEANYTKHFNILVNCDQ